MVISSYDPCNEQEHNWPAHTSGAAGTIAGFPKCYNRNWAILAAGAEVLEFTLASVGWRNSVVSSARRDLKEMADFGISEQSLSNVEALRDAFADMPTDEELSGMMVSMTDEKKAKSKALQGMIRNIMARVGNRFGVKSGQYKRFGTEGLSRLNDAEFDLRLRLLAP